MWRKWPRWRRRKPKYKMTRRCKMKKSRRNRWSSKTAMSLRTWTSQMTEKNPRNGKSLSGNPWLWL